MSELERYTLNNQSVWRGRLNRYNGKILENPAHFIIRPLNRDDAASMGNLSAEIYQHLNQGEECFIHQHEKSYYSDVFNNTDTRYIGIFAGSELIGMSYLRICRDQQAVNEELPNSPVNFFNRRPDSKVAAFGADCVLPQYRGNNLNQIMISCRLEMAKDLNCTDAVSIVDRHNHWNMPPYFNNDFRMFATAIDPADGGQIALMHHKITETRPSQIKLGTSIPYNRFEIIDNLLQKGFVGSSYDKESATILFTPTNRAMRYFNRSTNFVTLPLNKGSCHV